MCIAEIKETLYLLVHQYSHWDKANEKDHVINADCEEDQKLVPGFA